MSCGTANSPSTSWTGVGAKEMKDHWSTNVQGPMLCGNNMGPGGGVEASGCKGALAYTHSTNERMNGSRHTCTRYSSL
jgi:hypothetical protein